MSHVSHFNEPCLTFQWVMSMSHVTHTWCQPYEGVMWLMHASVTSQNIVPHDLILALISFLWHIIFAFYYTRVRPQCDFSVRGRYASVTSHRTYWWVKSYRSISEKEISSFKPWWFFRCVCVCVCVSFCVIVRPRAHVSVHTCVFVSCPQISKHYGVAAMSMLPKFLDHFSKESYKNTALLLDIPGDSGSLLIVTTPYYS